MSQEIPENDRTASVAILTEGSIVGHYKIIRHLGAGGMGEVYLAEDTGLKRQVALKFLSPHLCTGEDNRKRFAREARAAAKLDHPHIVTVHEVAEHQGRPFFAMAYVEGQLLKDIVSPDGIRIDQVFEFGIQIGQGLEAAHDAGVTHRDIKPSNILIDSHSRARIVDFGLAIVRGAEDLTQTGSTLGTIGYMSPEQVRGEEIDHRSDIFSLGVVLYELITGQPPFRSNSQAATLHAITHNEPVDLDSLRSDIPAGLQEVIGKSLEKNKAQRYQSVTELVSDLQRLRSGSKPIAAPKETAPSIAVLPFANLSADPDQEYFCDGIAEDIISDLTHLSGLRVVARTSAFAFKGKNDDIREIGRKLNVGYVVEGSVRKGGDRIRATVQLIEVATGFHLWSEKYDRQLKDIFAIQDEISKAIVDKLKLEFSGDVSKGRSQSDTPIEAYQLYSQGRHQLNRRTPEGFDMALDFFRRSRDLSPAYAPVQAGLADAYFLIFAYDLMRPRDAIARARIAAQKAIELDNALADPHATLGGLHTYYDWAWDDAEIAFKRALELSPGHACAHQWYAELLSFLDRNTEAEQHFQTALHLDPLSPVLNTMIGWHNLRVGRLEDALQYLTRAKELGSSSDFTFVLAGEANLALGREEQGLTLLTTAREKGNDSALSLSTWGRVHARRGQSEITQECLNQLLEMQKKEYIPQAYLVSLYNDLGQEDQALACLKEAIRRRDAELIFIAVMPSYTPVRANPRLADLISVLGLPSRDSY